MTFEKFKYHLENNSLPKNIIGFAIARENWSPNMKVILIKCKSSNFQFNYSTDSYGCKSLSINNLLYSEIKNYPDGYKNFLKEYIVNFMGKQDWCNLLGDRDYDGPFFITNQNINYNSVIENLLNTTSKDIRDFSYSTEQDIFLVEIADIMKNRFNTNFLTFYRVELQYKISDMPNNIRLLLSI